MDSPGEEVPAGESGSRTACSYKENAMKLSQYTRLTLTVLGLISVEILLLAATQFVNTDIKLVLGFCAGFFLIPTSQFVHLWLASGVSE